MHNNNTEPNNVPLTAHSQPAPANNLDDVSACLGTIQLRICLPSGAPSAPIRGFCDSGSQISLITEAVVQHLQLVRNKTKYAIHGIGADAVANRMVDLHIIHRANDTDPVLVKALVVPRIASYLPDRKFTPPFNDIIPLGELADPIHNYPGPIDILLGAGVWANIVCDGIKRNIINDRQSIAQLTTLGWVIYGQISTCSHLRLYNCHMSSDEEDIHLDKLMLRFWNADAIPEARQWTAEEQLAEQIFTSTVQRESNGRYIVRIPKRTDAAPLGNSQRSAKACFYSIEKKLQRNPELYVKYKAVFDDHRARKHMVLAAEKPVDDADSYYMPHHPINTNISGNHQRKFRVVFNASAATTTGTSFNDQQLPGPKLQDDLNAIFLRFRKRKFALTADIKQMFRQVNVSPLDWDHQRLIWRDSPSQPLDEYIMTVVTWGMTSAGFNAVRAMRQCAMDHRHSFPLGAQIALTDFYFDDMLSGADDEDQLMIAQAEVDQLLKSGGFELAKWTSNSSRLAMAISAQQCIEVEFPTESGVLGMRWSPQSDQLYVKTAGMHTEIVVEGLTKRSVISAIAKIFDPTGLVGPVVVMGKILQQEIWKSGISWDERLPHDLVNGWLEYRQNIMSLDEIRIPRWIGISPGYQLQLHIYCDASEKAAGAAGYIRVSTGTERSSVCLVTSKSKVAPTKRTTIPRLELSAALLANNCHGLSFHS